MQSGPDRGPTAQSGPDWGPTPDRGATVQSGPDRGATVQSGPDRPVAQTPVFLSMRIVTVSIAKLGDASLVQLMGFDLTESGPGRSGLTAQSGPDRGPTPHRGPMVQSGPDRGPTVQSGPDRPVVQPQPPILWLNAGFP